MDSEQRQLYNADLDRVLADEDDGYTGELLSRWMAGKKMGKNKDPAESRGVFVVSLPVLRLRLGGCWDSHVAAAVGGSSSPGGQAGSPPAAPQPSAALPGWLRTFWLPLLAHRLPTPALPCPCCPCPRCRMR